MENTEKIATRLHAAIAVEDLEKVKNLLRKYENQKKELCGAELPREGTALHKAAKTGNTDICGVILDTGVNINSGMSGGFVVTNITPLICAVTANHLQMVEFLLSLGANVNAQDSEGQTSLHISCQGNNSETARLLLRNGADSNLKDNKGQTPLHYAILRSASSATFRLLIDNEAEVNRTDRDGQTPLHYAAEWGEVETAELLLTHGATVNASDKAGQTPLHLASDDDMKSLLMSKGADFTLRTSKGQLAVFGKINKRGSNVKQMAQALNKQLELSKIFETRRQSVHQPSSKQQADPKGDTQVTAENDSKESQNLRNFTEADNCSDEADKKESPSVPQNAIQAVGTVTNDKNSVVETKSLEIATNVMKDSDTDGNGEKEVILIEKDCDEPEENRPQTTTEETHVEIASDDNAQEEEIQCNPSDVRNDLTLILIRKSEQMKGSIRRFKSLDSLDESLASDDTASTSGISVNGGFSSSDISGVSSPTMSRRQSKAGFERAKVDLLVELQMRLSRPSFKGPDYK